MKIYNASDFNMVLSEYDSILEFAEECIRYPGRKTICSKYVEKEVQALKDKGFYYTVPIYRVLINNISMYFSKVDENTLESSEDVVQDTLFDRVDSLKDIKSTDPNMTFGEKKHQLRNCLSHGNIETELEGRAEKEEGYYLGELSILVDNGFVSGKIPSYDFSKIGKNVKKVDNFLRRGYDYHLIYGFIDFIPNSIEELIDGMKKIVIQRRYDDSLLPFEQAKYKFLKANQYRNSKDWRFNPGVSNNAMKAEIKSRLTNLIRGLRGDYTSFDYKEETISKEKKEFLARYTKYMTGDSVMEFFNNPSIMNEVMEDLNSADTDSSLDSSYVSEATIIAFITTVIEIQSRIAKTINEKKNVGYKEKEEMASAIEKFSYEGPYIYTANLIGKANYLIGFIQELSKGNHFDYNGFTSLNGINATLIKHIYNVGNTSNVPDNSLVLSEPAAVGQRQNSSNFFRHFRNAIAHGNYKIEYGDYKDPDSYVLKFNDIKRDKNDHERILREYRFELSPKQLIAILKEYQDRVNDNLRTNNIENQFGKKLLEDTIRETKENDGDLLEEMANNIKIDNGEEIEN